MKLVIVNGHIVSPCDERIANLWVENGLIANIGTDDSKDDVLTLDADNCWVTPGLIDLQVNGAPACDFWGDPDNTQVSALADQLVRAGVTTILPTLITDDLKHLRKNVDFLEQSFGVGDLKQLTPPPA